MQSTENAPVEETEVNYPVQIVRYELIPDSEGAGKYRGGLGLRRDYRPEGDVTFSVLADRVKLAPQGLAGGGPARSARLIQNPDTEPRAFSSKMSVALTAGEVFSVQMAGGGGYGPAWERDPLLVLEDVLAERVSVERARTVYGVVIDLETGAVDEAATERARATMEKESPTPSRCAARISASPTSSPVRGGGEQAILVSPSPTHGGGGQGVGDSSDVVS